MEARAAYFPFGSLTGLPDLGVVLEDAFKGQLPLKIEILRRSSASSLESRTGRKTPQSEDKNDDIVHLLHP